MMAFNDFIKKHNLKNKATSNIQIQQVLDSIGLDNVGIFLGDGPFSTDIGIVNSHPWKGTHWVLYLHESYFDSYGITLPKKLSKFIIKRNGHCLYSQYKTRGLLYKKNSFCASYFLYKIY